jgi:hypothetical protein
MIQVKVEDYTLQDERIMKMWAVEQAVQCLKMLSPSSNEIGKFADKILVYVNTNKNESKTYTGPTITQVELDNGEKFDVREDIS